MVRLRDGAIAILHSMELWESKFLSVVSIMGCLIQFRHGEDETDRQPFSFTLNAESGISFLTE